MQNKCLLIGLLLIISCTKTLYSPPLLEAGIDTLSGNQDTKASLIRGISDYSVTERDINSYINFLEVGETDPKRGKVTHVETIPYKDEISYYIIEYENGWDMISSDKRGPIILGKSEYGDFEYEALNPSMKAWITGLSEDIYYRRHFEEDYYKNMEFPCTQEDSCLEFWLMVTAAPDYISLFQTPETKVAPVVYDSGHWEVFYQYHDDGTPEDTGHLLTTHWGQDSPFNQYCPLKSDGSGQRAPAGCVPIAAAQEMFYLHNKLGKPQYSPSAGSCLGTVGNYSSTFYDFTSYTWESMYPTGDPQGYASLLISDIGAKLLIEYDNEGSGADDADLPDDVFLPYGLTCTRTNYNSELLKNSINKRIPVIVSAYTYDPLLDFIPWFAGHCFIADRCTQIVTRYYTVYTFIYDFPDLPHPLPPDNYTVLSTTTQELMMVGFNWGWGAYSGDDVLFSPNGAWNVNEDYNFLFQRKMIYDFE